MSAIFDVRNMRVVPALGTNLIPSASSNFDTDGTGWWSFYGGTKSWNASGYMVLTGTGVNVFLYQWPGLKASTLYRFSISLRSSTSTSRFSVYGGDGGGGTTFWTSNITSSWMTSTGNFTTKPSAEPLYIQLEGSLGNGETIEVDNIIAQEIL